jgi:hypothetical protein
MESEGEACCLGKSNLKILSSTAGSVVSVSTTAMFIGIVFFYSLYNAFRPVFYHRHVTVIRNNAGLYI